MGLSWTSTPAALRGVIPLASELPRLIVLAMVTGTAFAGTQWFARHERTRQLSDAAAWRERGDLAMRSGDANASVVAFRRAVSLNRNDRESALALAAALTRSEQTDEAQRVLESLREQRPDDAEVTLRLARLAANRGDLTAATHDYQRALYALAPDPAKRLAVRLEVGGYLLGQGRRAEALSELIAAVPDAAARPSQRLALANLLLQSGESRLALQEYRGLLADDSSNGPALAGAGAAAFALGQYAVAAMYLQQAPPSPDVNRRLAIATAVVTRDPLAPRLGPSERRRRALANLTTTKGRLRACRGTHTDEQGGTALDTDVADIDALIRSGATSARDAIEEGLVAIDRAQRTIATLCSPVESTDEALRILASMHLDTP
jgi:tetratricopeptide (TPR) repeat protein